MTAKAKSQNKRPAKAQNKTAGQESAFSGLMATVSAGEGAKSTIDNFANALDKITEGDAADTVAQVQEVIEQATVTAGHAITTIKLAKKAFKSARATAKDVLVHAIEKPEPFVVVTVPAIVGLFLLYRGFQSRTPSVPHRTRRARREANVVQS